MFGRDERGRAERLSTAFIHWGCAVTGRFRRLRRPGATLTAVLVALYAIAQIARANDFPKASMWATHAAGWWIYVVLAVIATVASLLVVLGYRSSLAVQHERDRFAKLANGVVRVVEKKTPLRHDEIGVNIWALQGLKGFRRLERRAIAVAQERRATPVLWTKGKGAIGRCWARNESTFADMEELRRVLSTESSFYGQPRDERFRFSWNEFQDTKRYAAVLAVPLRPRIYGRYVVRGVLSIDVMTAGKGKHLEGVQEDAEFGGIIRTCEAVLSRGLDE